MSNLYLEDGTPAGLGDVTEWWLEHYEGLEHMTEGGTVSPETWYTINTILRRCFSRFKEGKESSMPNKNTTLEQEIDELLNKFDPFDNSHNDFIRRKPIVEQELLSLFEKYGLEVIGEDENLYPEIKGGARDMDWRIQREMGNNEAKMMQRQRLKQILGGSDES